MVKDYTQFLQKYFGGHYGRINAPRMLVDDNGTVDFDIGSEKLYFEGANSYAGVMDWYLFFKIGKSWIASQSGLTTDKMHPLVYWHHLAMLQLQNRKDGGTNCFCGAEICWRYLGYHLALIGEHAELSSKLIKRLRDPNHFQGARFEISIAAAMIVAGFNLEYEPEKGPGKHPEFIATDNDSGLKFAVEAKSKKRTDVLGHVDQGAGEATLEAGVRRLLRDAIDKDTELPLIAFVEVNLPDLFSIENEKIDKELKLAVDRLDKSKWSEVGFPCVGGFYVNDASAHHLEAQIDLKKQYAWALPFSFENRHNLDARNYLNRILEGFAKAARIPDINWKNPKFEI
jgi:hypothetical protein